MDILKSQILTITALKGSGGHSNAPDNSIMNAIYGIMLLTFLEQLFKYLPIIGFFIKTHAETYFKKKYSTMKIINTISTITNVEKSSIVLERTYNTKDSSSSSVNGEYVESILDYISKLPNIKKLKYRTSYFISHKEEFVIDDKITGKCLELLENLETGDVERITIEVKSTVLDIQELRAYLNNIYKNYIIAKKNQLGDQTYFFDHIIHGNTNLPLIRFDMTPFNTNKSLKTIYGKYMSNVVQRINFFIKNKDWYIKKGIPHTLGLLLHGPPGCGKTSLIKAIARDTNRHIINIQLNKNITQTQLKTLFFSEEICVYNKKTNMNELFIIPLDKRIYIMEDVDAISDILYSRDIIQAKKELEYQEKMKEYEAAKELAKRNGYPPPRMQDDNNQNKEEITLAFILNLLDGILETPGRIIILTTNHPEKLDEALVRPGRIDINIHFDRCSKETVVELVDKFYEDIDKSSNEWLTFVNTLDTLEEFMLTPAEVNKIIFNNYNDYITSFNEIITFIETKIKEQTPVTIVNTSETPSEPTKPVETTKPVEAKREFTNVIRDTPLSLESLSESESESDSDISLDNPKPSSKVINIDSPEMLRLLQNNTEKRQFFKNELDKFKKDGFGRDIDPTVPSRFDPSSKQSIFKPFKSVIRSSKMSGECEQVTDEPRGGFNRAYDPSVPIGIITEEMSHNYATISDDFDLTENTGNYAPF